MAARAERARSELAHHAGPASRCWQPLPSPCTVVGAAAQWNSASGGVAAPSASGCRPCSATQCADSGTEGFEASRSCLSLPARTASLHFWLAFPSALCTEEALRRTAAHHLSSILWPTMLALHAPALRSASFPCPLPVWCCPSSRTNVCGCTDGLAVCPRTPGPPPTFPALPRPLSFLLLCRPACHVLSFPLPLDSVLPPFVQVLQLLVHLGRASLRAQVAHASSRSFRLAAVEQEPGAAVARSLLQAPILLPIHKAHWQVCQHGSGNRKPGSAAQAQRVRDQLVSAGRLLLSIPQNDVAMQSGPAPGCSARTVTLCSIPGMLLTSEQTAAHAGRTRVPAPLRCRRSCRHLAACSSAALPRHPCRLAGMLSII